MSEKKANSGHKNNNAGNDGGGDAAAVVVVVAAAKDEWQNENYIFTSKRREKEINRNQTKENAVADLFSSPILFFY